jgi:hypothetical protein
MTKDFVIKNGAMYLAKCLYDKSVGGKVLKPEVFEDESLHRMRLCGWYAFAEHENGDDFGASFSFSLKELFPLNDKNRLDRNYVLGIEKEMALVMQSLIKDILSDDKPIFDIDKEFLSMLCKFEECEKCGHRTIVKS